MGKVVHVPDSVLLKSFEDFGESGNLGANVSDSFVYENKYGFNTIAFYLTIPIGATVEFQSSFDGVNYVKASMRSIDFDDYTQKSVQSSHFIGSISSARYFRVIVTAAGSASGSVIGRCSQEVSTLEGIENGWRPDNFGNPQTHIDFTATMAQTDTVIWTPATGKKVVVTGMIVASDAINIVSIFDETDAMGNRLFKNRFPNNASPFSHSFMTPFVSSAADNEIKVTSSANANLDIVLHGYEID